MKKRRAGAAAIVFGVCLGMTASAQTPTPADPATTGKPVPPQPAVPQRLDTPGVPIPAEPPNPGSETLDDAAVSPARDSSAEASPLLPGNSPKPQRLLPKGVPIEVQLDQAVSSGVQKNGDSVRATLAAPLRMSSGVTLPVGTRVQATVVAAAKAGTMNSGGVLTLQLTHIGNLGVVSDVREFDGKAGHTDVADSAPAQGTEAQVAAGTKLRFELMENGPATGLMPGAGGVQPGQTVGSGGRQGLPGVQQAPGGSGSPSTQPGVNQHPVGGATQGVVPRPPSE